MNIVTFLKSHYLILIVLILSIALHLIRIQSLTTFGGDLGYDLLNVKKIISSHFVLLGPKIGPYGNNITLYLGPFYYYLLAPFLMVTNLDPIGASYAIVLARTLTVVFVYLISLKLFSKPIAITASILAAVSPYWVNYLGFPSNPYFILPLLSFLILILIRRKKTISSAAVIGILIGLLVQLHYLAIIIIFPLVPLLYQERKNYPQTFYLAFISGFLLSLFPLLLFEIRNHFFISKQFIYLFANPPVEQHIAIINKIRTVIEFIGADFFGSLNIVPTLLALVATVTALLSFKFKKGHRKYILFLSQLTMLDLIVVVLGPLPAQAQYLALAYPTIFIFSAFVIHSFKRINKNIPYLLTIIITLFLISKNDLFRSSGYAMPQDLTLPVIRNISHIIASDVDGHSFTVTSTLDGDSRALSYRYLLEVYGTPSQSVENYHSAQDLYVVTRDPPDSVSTNNLFEISSFQPSNLQKSWNITGDIRLVKLTKSNVSSPEKIAFITLVNPIRPRSLWSNQNVVSLKNQLQALNDRNLQATWLLSYDNLFDNQILEIFKSQNNQEIGALLEVSEKWATDSHVQYKIDQGDYYRPDKVFLSGYSPQDRKKLIDNYFKKFKEVFDNYPQSVGAWYLDANSQLDLAKYKVTSALTLSDQFNTDAESIWGKYISMPFYPSITNTLEPANSQIEKIPLVNIQWAQRDLVNSYGSEIKDSRQSFQANDYINNGFDHRYFDNLLSQYLENLKNNDFMQITIGLEAGQEATGFFNEYLKQLDSIKELKNNQMVQTSTMQQFSKWYDNQYPGISPQHLLQKDDNYWFMSPKFRVAIFKKGPNFFLEDLRYYTQIPFPDYYTSDKSPFLQRNTPATIDNIKLQNELNLGSSSKIKLVQNFDRLILTLDNSQVEIDTKGVRIKDQYVQTNKMTNYYQRFDIKLLSQQLKWYLSRFLSIFKYSNLNGQRIFGISPNDTYLVGIKGLTPGYYRYDFQTLSRFLSPANLIKRL